MFAISLTGWRRRAGAAAFGVILLAGAVAHAAAVPPLEDFFGNNAFGGARMSPNGRYLAVRTSHPGRRDFLAVIDLETKSVKSVAAFNDLDVGKFRWVNDNRLVFNVHDTDYANADQDAGPGLFAVDRDGTNYLQLAHRHYNDRAPQPWNTFLLDQAGSQDSEWIYVARPMYERDDTYLGTRLVRLNTLTGAAEPVKGPAAKVDDYLLDAQGKPRLAVVHSSFKTTLYYNDPATATWRKAATFDRLGIDKEAIKPLGFDDDGKLYVAANGGEDLATLRTFDVDAGTVAKEPIVVTPGYDFDGELLGHGKLLGVRLTTDARADVWFDPAMKALQQAVNKAVPGAINMIDAPASPGMPWVLVASYSDRQPLRYLLYYTQTGVVELVGNSYPKIDPAQMGRQQPIRYTARDGLEIPGLLTLPPGGARKNLPMVVLVHGGPWVRGASWGWDPDVQFLATRGYAVLEVEFRGSTGFGVRHFAAGVKQWGLAMQDDIADGTRWAIRQGIADPKRICIAGASYGGYATLMGLVNDPDLYRCGIDWVGVTDIELMYTGTWYAKSDASAGALRYGMPFLIGDPVKDAAQLKATSPIQQAARIRQPLLLAYGEMDRRVPLYHGDKFYAAIKQTNEQVEWVTYAEGHGWSLPKNRIDFWQRVERFLDRQIGPGSR